MRIIRQTIAVYSIILSFLLLNGLQANAQIIFDGINCNNGISAHGTGTEWGASQASDFDGVNPTSSNLQEFWARIQGPFLYVAFSREGKGNAGFAMHMDTDCDDNTGNSTYKGSDFSIFFSIQTGVVQDSTLFQWDTTLADYVDSGLEFSPLIGGKNCTDTTDEEFFELRILLSDLMEVCNASCGSLNITQANIHSGGSFSSTIKDELALNLSLSINEDPLSVITGDHIVCVGDVVSLSGLSSDANPGLSNYDYISTYEWDHSYDGITFNVESTGGTLDTIYTTSTSHLVALRVQDAFGCESSIDTFTISTFVRPTLVYDVIGGNQCGKIHNYSGGSIDNAGADNLTYYWDLGDGNTSTLDSFTHNYGDCSYYSMFIMVTDPDNPTECESDSIIISSVLPVELIEFEAEIMDKTVLLKWATASEINSSHFIVEKSTDGEYYTELELVEAQGTEFSIKNYSVQDYSLNSGTSFYRLKMVDFDGVFSYSKTIEVLNNQISSTINVYPNPASDQLYIENQTAISAIELYDIHGSLVLSHINSSRLISQTIDISQITAGAYLLKVIDLDNFGHTERLIIQ
ncbi:MAG: T9SS type A sorting domain-containing protein [Bacteroidia bacterium]